MNVVNGRSFCKEAYPERYKAAEEVLGSWFSNRLDDLYIENLKRISEDIKHGKELPKRIPELSRHPSPEEGQSPQECG